MKKDNLKSIIVLFACCLIISLLLAAINLITAPIIKENSLKAQLAALEGLVPNADYEEKIGLENLPSSIEGIFVDKNGGGVAIVFSASSQYSSSPMQYAVGINMDGKIISIKKIVYMESKDFGNYPDSFVGKEYADIDSVDAFAGVTYSSDAFKQGLKDAYAAFYTATGGELKKTELDVLNSLIEGTTFKMIDTEAKLSEGVTAVYRANASTYAFSIVDGETVTLVVSDILGKIICAADYESGEKIEYSASVLSDIRAVIASDIIGKVMTPDAQFEFVDFEPVENTVKTNISHTGDREFTARTVAAFQTGEGYTLLVESQGYAAVENNGEPIVIAVGFDNDGKIIKTHVISHAETQKFGGDKVINNTGYTDKYIGLDTVPEDLFSFIDGGSYATYSYTGYHNGVHTAYLAITAIISETGGNR